MLVGPADDWLAYCGLNCKNSPAKEMIKEDDEDWTCMNRMKLIEQIFVAQNRCGQLIGEVLLCFLKQT